MDHQQVIIFGEVLFDCFPDNTALLGGAPFNVAWHLCAFGVLPLFISSVGYDDRGRHITNIMQEWGLDVSGLQTDSVYQTGVVEILFKNNEPCYDIREDCAYDHISTALLPDLKKGGLLYHGTLALRNRISANTLESIRSMMNPYVFMDVNLRSPWWTRQLIHQLLPKTDWLKLNNDELSSLIPGSHSEMDRIRQLKSENKLDLISVTKGSHGACTYQAEGSMETVIPEKYLTGIVDTVGAGDAFSSILLLGNIKGWPMDVTLERAQQFAGKIITIRSATTSDRSFYQPFLDDWN